jgi:hypothetical protein
VQAWWLFSFTYTQSMKIRLVVATRVSEEEFFTSTLTGRSLKVNHPDFVELKLFANNQTGLPTLYNQIIRESRDDPATLVFAHDDLLLLDFYWCKRLIEGLEQFSVVGLAGNINRAPRQPTWWFVDEQFNWDRRENLSGVIGHGAEFPPENISFYGPPRQQVKLMDGVLLAAHSQTFVDHELYFDEQFDFHFYDLDFCRQAEIKNIDLGTWDISFAHGSKGNCGTESWRQGYLKYINKWVE